MNRTVSLLLMLALAACSQQPAQEAERSPAIPAAAPAAPMQAAMLSVPKDPAQLKKVLAMGYTVHEDHLHAPGVSTCPKAGDGPVM